MARKSERKVKPATKKKRSVTAGLDPVVLGGRPGIKTIVKLGKQLQVVHDGKSTVIIDAGKVESIDIAALQLLVAFANSVRKQSRNVDWRKPSSAFCEMADLADLSRCLGIGEHSVAEEDDGLCPVF